MSNIIKNNNLKIKKTECYYCSEKTQELIYCSCCSELMWLCNTCLSDKENIMCNYCIIDSN